MVGRVPGGGSIARSRARRSSRWSRRLPGTSLRAGSTIGYPVAPASATRAYARLAERLGATLAVGDRAVLAMDGDAATGVVVDGRLVPAEAVVIAAGPWTPDVIGRHRRLAADRQLVGRRRLDRSRAAAAATSSRRSTSRSSPATRGDGGRRLRGWLRVQPGDGRRRRARSGRRFCRSRPEPSSVIGRLRDRGARYVPAIASAPVEGMRTCARPVTPDGRPLIGAVPGIRGAFVAAGNGPWGISTGSGYRASRRRSRARARPDDPTGARRRPVRRAGLRQVTQADLGPERDQRERLPGYPRQLHDRRISASSPGRGRRTTAGTSVP